jgi:hypothetical protein
MNTANKCTPEMDLSLSSQDLICIDRISSSEAFTVNMKADFFLNALVEDRLEKKIS